MKRKKHNGKFIKWTVSVFLTFLIFTGCRKTDNIWSDPKMATENYNLLKSKFFNASTADQEVQKVAADIRKQDSLFKFLPEFVKKNGMPKWDKVLYKTKGKSIAVSLGNIHTESNSIANNSSNTSTEGEQGLFFIPLQAENSQEIKSYITAYKHGDSTYTYKLYNKDSLSSNSYQDGNTKKALVNSLGILAFFEKSINNQETSQYNLSSNEVVEFKNPNVILSDTEPANQSGINSNSLSTSSTTGCSYSITITETWTEVNVYVNGELVYHYESYEVSVVAVFQGDCSGGGGGGGYDPNGGGSSGWYNWGTGYNNDPYWNNYNYNGWLYPWWTSGGGTGGGGGGFLYEIVPDPNILGDFVDDPNVFEDDPTQVTFDFDQDPWPTISNVLSPSQFVGYDYRNCLTLAKDQIAKVGLRDLGYGSAFKVYDANGGPYPSVAKSGINYIITKLQSGKPVIVGVDNRPGTPSSTNADGKTDHFVTIVGSGQDSQGSYLTFYDNATNIESKGTSSLNKLYYDATTGTITGKSAVPYANVYGDYIVTQIRKNQ